MGVLFSTTDTTDDDYNKSIAALKDEVKQLELANAAAEQVKKETLEMQYQRQKEIAAQRIAEIKETIRRAEELKNARQLLNIQAAVLLCAIYYNYPFGTLDESDSDNVNWQTNAQGICDIAVNKNTFWLLCKVPQLLPLMWPTGREDDAFHQYKSRDKTGIPDAGDYLIEIKSNLDEYIKRLKTYITNVFQSNCSRDLEVDTDAQDKLFERCSEFIKKTENVSTDNEWLSYAFAFIKDDDRMRWKGFVARSGKGICKSTIELLPSTYPKVCPKYELYEALLMLSNTVINHYGEYDGGQCFALDSGIEEKVYNNAINTIIIWDGESFVQPSTVDEKDILGTDDTEKWMKDTSVYNQVETYYLNNGDKVNKTNGITRYVNPTKGVTNEFINDIDGITLPFKISKLSASINDEFRESFLYNAFITLTTDKENVKYDLYRTNNKMIFTSIDYMTLRPPALDEYMIEDNVMPIPRFIYTCLIEYSCKWNLTIPINSTMSMSQINTNIMNEFDISRLPQYLWTSSPNVIYKEQDDDNVVMKNVEEPKQMLSESVMTAVSVEIENVAEIKDGEKTDVQK